jgi:hypothetical protein
MKRKTLLLFVMSSLITGVYAQKAQKQVTGFAITADEKGKTGWKEVRQVNVNTGEELQIIYKASQEPEILNARTGKPVVKKDLNNATGELKTRTIIEKDNQIRIISANGDKVIETTKEKPVYTIDGNGNLQPRAERKVIIMRHASVVHSDKPFATNSAAMAYDKKHERLYYTPMNVAQLRYIDLKSKSPKIYYFEDEKFGSLSGPGDVANQITRMVIASDGNGYALSNDARHLTRFTTGKKPEITDLGTLSDDPANGTYSVHNSRGYGGDIIADASKNLYLITANRNVFKISIETKVATYLGSIKGLPKGYSTNGAMVEEGGKVIVASSELTLGYFRFDLEKMDQPAEKISGDAVVFNASDLANGNLAFAKKKKDKKEPKEEEIVQEEIKDPVVESVAKPSTVELVEAKGIGVYPNPVTSGYVKLSFEDQPAGKYQVQLLDVGGKLISSKEITISNKIQVEELRLPELSVRGNYFVKITSEANKVSSVTKLVVQ